MRPSTAIKISGICLLAVAAESLLAYLIFSNYAFSLADIGQYSSREAYSTGPMATVAMFFYGVFGVTVAIGVGAPLVSLLSLSFRKKSKNH